VDAISLDKIDTTAAWRVEIERLVMESIFDWLEKEALEELAALGEKEVEEEEQEMAEEQQEEEVTPPRMVTNRGHQMLLPISSSRVRQKSNFSRRAFFL